MYDYYFQYFLLLISSNIPALMVQLRKTIFVSLKQKITNNQNWQHLNISMYYLDKLNIYVYVPKSKCVVWEYNT